jgi:hypothetical protein
MRVVEETRWKKSSARRASQKEEIILRLTKSEAEEVLKLIREIRKRDE